MTKLNLLFLVTFILFFSLNASAQNIEEQLNQSCLASKKNMNDLQQKMCACQAKKWASGKLQSATKTINIEQKLIDALKVDWKSKEPGIPAIAIEVGNACVAELNSVNLNSAK